MQESSCCPFMMGDSTGKCRSAGCVHAALKSPPLARWGNVSATGLPIALAWQACAMELSHHPSTRWNNARVELCPFVMGDSRSSAFSAASYEAIRMTGWDGRKEGR